MNSTKGRVAIVGSTSLALLLAGGSLVAAASPTTTTIDTSAQIETGADTGPLDAWLEGIASDIGAGQGPLRNGEHRPLLRLRDRLVEAARHLVTSQTTFEYDGAFITRQSEHGTIAAVGDGSITVSLATGVQATTATDAGTLVFKLGDPATQTRPERISLADLQPGDEVVVVSRQEDDGTFLVHRIAVLPAAG
jgi:hypothetical protein